MINLLLLFGGQSNEHYVSNISAYNIINSMNKEKYNITKIGITKDGKWYLVDCDNELIKKGEWINTVKKEAFISPSKSQKGIVVLNENSFETVPIDVCFPILHGDNGEDGTIQALLKLAGIRRVGADLISTAMAMDKKVSKIIFKDFDIPVVPSLYADKNYNLDEIKEKITLPVFVKPSNSGSSVGCKGVFEWKDLKSALEESLKIDECVLIEKYINCREIECAILGNDNITVSEPGEITNDSEFYDFDTKYINTQSVKLQIPANITNIQKEKIKDYAKRAYIALGLCGMTRADFFIDKDNGDIYLNEVNTIPGFTSLSMYPLLMKNMGIEYSDLIDTLINLAK